MSHKPLVRPVRRVHFVGIGGSGMSGIAEVLLTLGYRVSGSDLKRTPVTERLERLGARIRYGHRESNIGDAEVVVFSSAVDPHNPEIVRARRDGVPVIPRIEMLAEIARLKRTVSICGTHGKTTTTSLMGLVLETCGYDPTIVVGGTFRNMGSGARTGTGEYIVVESDESDGSFLKLSPAIAICTNIDNDHVDHYGSFERLCDAFVEHLNAVPFYGYNMVCGDDPGVRGILPRLRRRVHTYGTAGCNEFTARDIRFSYHGVRYTAWHRRRKIGAVSLRASGIHNVRNSLAVLACAYLAGLSWRTVRRALAAYQGVGRRLEFKGTIPVRRGTVEVYDDYGHHPTEIRATLEALRTKTRKRPVVVFQPHRFTRTRALWREFAGAFDLRDRVRLLPLYPAGERPIPGVSERLILNELRRRGGDVRMYDEHELVDSLRPGEVLLTLGAGSVSSLSDHLVKAYGIPG